MKCFRPVLRFLSFRVCVCKYDLGCTEAYVYRAERVYREITVCIKNSRYADMQRAHLHPIGLSATRRPDTRNNIHQVKISPT